ncbi:hypothetical protein PGTUg99_024158 [Puccinia graminis f. sp. tritici]|uniref:Uncharacterized protein n=1 Tax=Puccinia graminis f. sp. tritici TaxID=56615 RepID=A0A5B0PJH0_PUCGR|nr:hypothetical protein PGTUg99_024158 [Puccinia graminis f. sp. tritici]
MLDPAQQARGRGAYWTLNGPPIQCSPAGGGGGAGGRVQCDLARLESQSRCGCPLADLCKQQTGNELTIPYTVSNSSQLRIRKRWRRRRGQRLEVWTATRKIDDFSKLYRVRILES